MLIVVIWRHLVKLHGQGKERERQLGTPGLARIVDYGDDGDDDGGGETLCCIMTLSFVLLLAAALLSSL